MLKKMKKISVFDCINYTLMVLFALVTVYPLYYALIGSFSHGTDYMAGGVWLFPRIWTWKNYAVVFRDARLYRAFLNTVVRIVAVTAVQILLNSMVAYALHRKELRFKKFFRWFNLFTLFFSGGIVPYFYVMNLIGLYDTYWVYILPSVYSVYNMIVIQNFYKGMPEELHEAAVLEGASEYKVWFSIYLPLSMPILATVALWVCTGTWNNFMTNAIYAPSENLITLQFYLRQLIQSTGNIAGDFGEAVTGKTVAFAGIIVASLPVIFLYPLVQKNFAKGSVAGAVKG